MPKQIQLKKWMFLLLAMFTFNVAFAQKYEVSGTVKNAAGNVVSATVTEKGTQNAVSTNDAGVFHITINPGATLVITSVGFSAREVPVGNAKELAITMSENATTMSDVVVTALGIKREKKSLGYAVQEIKGESLVNAREPNIVNSLTGKVAGLQVTRSSNGPAGSSKITLRGNNSLTGSNQPLIVVDGIPIDNFTGAANNDFWNPSLDNGNGMADLNPDDIESMSVLKGPSAAALYGSRAGNGVIMITTKSGRAVKGLGITVTSSLGFEKIFTKPELQTTYGQGTEGSFKDDVLSNWGEKIAGQNFKNWEGKDEPMTYYDNVKNYMQTGITQNYGISLQQQFRTTGIYTSVNYLKDKGLVPGSKLDRLNLMAKATTKFGANDRWSAETKVQYSNATANNRPLGGQNANNVSYGLYNFSNIIDIRDFAGAVRPDGKMLWIPFSSNSLNPYWNNKYNLNQDIRDRFIMNASLGYKFTSWLTGEIKAGGDLYNTNAETWTYGGSPLTNTGRYSLGKSNFQETNFSSMFTARKDNLFGKWGGQLTVGGNLMSTKNSALNSASGGEFVVPNFFSLNNGQNNPSVNQGFGQHKINSLYGTGQINYDGYFFVDLTWRNDWSSTLSKENQSFFYPSVSTSLVFTDMMNRLGSGAPAWLSYGKIRGSYAEVGNSLRPYELYNTFWIGKDPMGNTTAGRNSVLFDPNVVAELIKSKEAGVELRFLRNRFGLDFSWYKTNATNQLINLPMDPQSGYTARKINAGNIQNTGIELVADARILQNPDGLNWTLGANFSRNRNTIEELAEGVATYGLGGYDNVSVRAVVGGNYGEIYGTKFRRVEDKASPYYGQLILTGDGLPQAQQGAQVKIGDQQANGLLGISNGFAYKGLELNVLIDGRFGGQIFSGTQVSLQRSGNAAVTAPGGDRANFVVDGVIADAEGNFSKNTKEISQQQYWSAVTNTSGNLGISEANLYDATNIRVRNVNLSYDVPKSFLGEKVFQRAKLGVTANNLWMLKSHMRGLDPESVYATGTNATGFESGGLPTTRTVIFSLTLGF